LENDIIATSSRFTLTQHSRSHTAHKPKLELVGDQVSRTNHETWLSSKLPGLGLPFAHCVQIGGVNAPLYLDFKAQTRVYVTTHQQLPLRSAVQQEVSDTLRGATLNTVCIDGLLKDLVERFWLSRYVDSMPPKAAPPTVGTQDSPPRRALAIVILHNCMLIAWILGSIMHHDWVFRTLG
jgi:hypothetical protein